MIRKAKTGDLAQILNIYDAARRYMAASGNPKQWGDGYPEETMLRDDIQEGHLYVICDYSGEPHGVFAFILGADPTYAVIEEGAWKNDKPYGTIHRLAGDGTMKGLFSQCLEFCRTICPEIRVDTHHDNRTMQHLAEKYGFQRCGIIYVRDGSPRIAYQYAGPN